MLMLPMPIVKPVHSVHLQSMGSWTLHTSTVVFTQDSTDLYVLLLPLV